MSVSRSILLAAVLLSRATALSAQTEGTFGINLRVTGTNQLGVTWQASPGFAIRPSLVFDWTKFELPFASGESEVAIYGADVDLLFRASSAGRLTTYFGLGGGLLYYNPGPEPAVDAWLARLLIGARVTVVDRVAVFGELGLQYQSGDFPVGDSFSTTTFPLGIVVFLK